MSNLLALSALTLALLLAPYSDACAQLVTRVVDGDTLIVQGVGRVRLIGVDTPETVDPRRPVQYFGKEASEFTHRMAEGKVVRLEFDAERKDRFGRTLAYVYLPDGTFLNAEIVKQGYGHAYTQFPFMYSAEFLGYEREAREASLGLWARESTPSRVMGDVRVWVNIASGIYLRPHGTPRHGRGRVERRLSYDKHGTYVALSLPANPPTARRWRRIRGLRPNMSLEGVGSSEGTGASL